MITLRSIAKIWFFLTLLMLLSLEAHATAPAKFSFVVQGLPTELGSELQTNLAQQSSLLNAALKDPALLQQQLLRSSKDFLAANAYFKPKISIKVEQQKQPIRIFVQVHLGPKLPIAELDVKLSGAGREDSRLRHYLRHPPLRIGAPMRSDKYEKLKEDLFEIAHARGYIKSSFSQHSVEVDLKRYEARITLVFNTGNRYKFGRISIQPGPFRESFIRRFLRFKRGDYYSSKKLTELQQDLSNSQYFKTINIKPQLDKTVGKHVPLLISLTPRKSQQYLFGLGYGTDTGFRGSLGWNWRRVNSFGNKIKTFLKISQIQNSLIAQYIIPGHRPQTNFHSFDMGAVNTRTTAGNTHVATLAYNYHRRYRAWQQTFGISLNNELFRVNDKDARHHSVYLMPSTTWLKVHARNPVFAWRGYKIQFRLRGAPQLAMTNVDLAQAELHVKRIDSIAHMTRFIFRGDLGVTYGHNLSDLPLSLRFTAGGSQSVRGYNYQALGPGRFLKVASFEVQQRLYRKLFAAAFIDVGQVSNSFEDALAQGAGMGLMYASPIGPIEVTLAQAINKRGRPWQVQFIMGPDL